jgi:hypothetical protein
MRDRSVEALVDAAQELFARYPDRAATRRHASRFHWDRTNEELLELLRQAVAAHSLAKMRDLSRHPARLQ